jgi:precorrin-8X/cobalt-precorrin-8 methylmutase
MTRTLHPIEAESFRILRDLVDLSHLPPLSRAVAERVIHASADLTYAEDLVLDEDALSRGLEALRAGAPIIADVRMVAAGIAARAVRCALDEPVGESGASTRTAACVRAAARAASAAVWVIGCAPTALAELLVCEAAPAFVIGLPVGFVGAVEAKAALRASGIPAVTNRSPKGGSAVAAAAVNALLFFEEEG